MKFIYISFAYLSLFCLGFIDNSRGPVYPEILEYFNLTKSSGSLIFSLSSFMAFIGALTSKVWLGLLGAIRASKIALVLQVIACLIMGSVAGTEYGYKLFLLGTMLFGLGVGIQSVSFVATEQHLLSLDGGLLVSPSPLNTSGPLPLLCFWQVSRHFISDRFLEYSMPVLGIQSSLSKILPLMRVRWILTGHRTVNLSTALE